MTASDARPPSTEPLLMGHEQFVAEWCMGHEPEHGPDAQRLLAIVARVMPDTYRRLADGQSWGVGIVAPVVELGAVLDATERMPGSGPVITRAAAEDASARSELTVAKFLADRGLTVELEPELAGRRPDFRTVAPKLIYGEVVTPELSAPAQTLRRGISGALAELIELTPWGGRLEVVMSGDAEPAHVAAWLAERISDEVTEFAPIDVPLAGASFSLTEIDLAQGPQIGGTLELSAPALAEAVVQYQDGVPRTAVLRVSITDGRAGRILDAESMHFTHEHPTLVVIDTGGGPFAAKAWAPLIERRFQPTINTRFSAAGLFRRNLHIDSTHATEWTLLTNPYARNVLPAAIADLLQIATTPEPGEG